MAKFELLNNITHKNLKILTKKSAQFGDDVTGALIFPEEFAQVQREYPIFFQKNAETGAFQAVAIFGFKENENLFLDENGWHANYVPAVIEREPFLIGFQPAQEPGEAADAVIHIDVENPRITYGEEGQPVFLEFGGNTPYLEKISKILNLIHEGLETSKNMFAAFLALDLIEPMVLDIEFNTGEKYQSESFYTINQERFFALEGVSLSELHRTGHLYHAYMLLASLGNIRKLIDLRERRM